MAAMSTALTEFNDSVNSRTYTTSGHTTVKPKLVIQKRKLPTSSQGVAETSVAVIHATEDADGNVLSSKSSMQVIVRTPIQGQASDNTAVLAILRDIVAGDEFGTLVTTQGYLS